MLNSKGRSSFHSDCRPPFDQSLATRRPQNCAPQNSDQKASRMIRQDVRVDLRAGLSGLSGASTQPSTVMQCLMAHTRASDACNMLTYGRFRLTPCHKAGMASRRPSLGFRDKGFIQSLYCRLPNLRYALPSSSRSQCCGQFRRDELRLGYWCW